MAVGIASPLTTSSDPFALLLPSVRRQNMKVRINATGDTIVMKFLRPSPNVKLEGYILGYGSNMFSKQFIQLPENGQPYETEVGECNYRSKWRTQTIVWFFSSDSNIVSVWPLDHLTQPKMETSLTCMGTINNTASLRSLSENSDVMHCSKSDTRRNCIASSPYQPKRWHSWERRWSSRPASWEPSGTLGNLATVATGGSDPQLGTQPKY